MKRICTKCLVEKDIESFYKDKHSKEGRRRACIECFNKIPSKQTDYRRNKKFKEHYGITLEDYNNMLIKQNNSCAICFIKQEKVLSVDHCHKTGKVRGLLCDNCNKGLGHFKDNTSALQKAIDYLGQ